MRVKSIRAFIIVATCCGITVIPSLSTAQGRFQAPETRIVKAAPGAALTAQSSASPRAILAQYLRDHGRDEATAQSLAIVSQGPLRNGVTHVTFEQRVGGLLVHGTSAKAAFSASSELVHLIENLASVPGAIVRARINEQQAIAAAIANLYPRAPANAPSDWHRQPSATPVAIPGADGSMSAGFLVETWTQRTNQLHYTLVGGDGAILDVESRTSSEFDKYNVFVKNPTATPQTVVDGPGAGNEESPIGWLFADTQGSTHIRGNNVNAYLDVVSNNRSDSEGSPITDGQFLTVASLNQSPSAPNNRAVAVQNLFFLNNLIHDVLYALGFDEAAGNFQEDNFGLGGGDSDSVNAEAQDGGGINNANFATPRDGSNPRMQMYLWSGKGTHEVALGDVANTTYPANGAEFGPALTATGISGEIVLVNDGVEEGEEGTLTDGCETLSGLAGKIALIDRGLCEFVIKVKNAQIAGAIGVIVANNRDFNTILVMGGRDRTITIPSVFISQNSGIDLKTKLQSGTIRLKDPPPLQRDGDVDADIVYHEYCHGLTWRMIGNMSGTVAGAIGEGMSDFCALLINGDDVVGEYSFDDPRGIRRDPYDGYPRTYSDFSGEGIHDDGEIYAAIGWKLMQNFAGRIEDLFRYVVDGMNFTPPKPTFEHMRDGILAAVAANTILAGDDCLVWDAFADFGVGVGSQLVVKGQNVSVTESSALPATCTPVP